MAPATSLIPSSMLATLGCISFTRSCSVLASFSIRPAWSRSSFSTASWRVDIRCIHQKQIIQQHYFFEQWQVLPFSSGHTPLPSGPEQPQSVHSFAAARLGGVLLALPPVSAPRSSMNRIGRIFVMMASCVESLLTMEVAVRRFGASDRHDRKSFTIKRMEPRGFEPLTSSMPLRRSTN
jgi:hypothetical protein